MNKTRAMKALLLSAYCVPFAYLAIYGDAVCGTMLFYGLMLVVFALLCWIALKTNNAAVILIGNVLSFVASYIAAKLSSLEPMAYYFKPFTSYSLIVVISVAAMIVHAMIMRIHTSKKGTDSK